MSILLVEEARPPIVTTLYDVQRYTINVDARTSGHGSSFAGIEPGTFSPGTFSPKFSALSILLLLLAALALSGCTTNGGHDRLDLMPAPDAYGNGSFDLFIDNDPVSRNSQPEILFATDRAPAIPGDKRYKSYSNQRGHVLRLGIARVEVGHDKAVTWEQARRISLLKSRGERYPLHVASVNELGPLRQTVRPFDEGIELNDEPGRRFIAEIDRRLARSASNDVFIYVHGYKVNFEEPVLVASELWHFLGYNGAFIAFSWPTTANLLAYFSDVETASASARALRKLIVFVSEQSHAERIHIIGYSAGTRLVGRAIADLGLLGYGLSDDELRRHVRLGHVILTGSDLDRAALGGYILDGALRLPESVTVYASARDKALGFSSFLLGRSRSGQLQDVGALGPSTRAFFENNEKLRIIDVSHAEGSATGNGHAYFRASPWVSSDILMTLLFDLPPEDRGLVRPDELPLWRFPDDYVQRLGEALRIANPELFP